MEEILDPKDDVSMKCWFAAYTKPFRECDTRLWLESEGIECYLPMCYRLRKRMGKERRVSVPLIDRIIFFRATRQECKCLCESVPQRIFCIRDRLERAPAVIPDVQMRAFRLLADFPEGGVRVLNADLHVGQAVRVIAGPFAGIEGELMRVKGDRRVVVRLDGVVSLATTFIHPSMLERIDSDESCR